MYQERRFYLLLRQVSFQWKNPADFLLNNSDFLLQNAFWSYIKQLCTLEASGWVRLGATVRVVAETTAVKRLPVQEGAEVAICIKTDERCVKTDGFCIKTDGFCI